MNKPTTADCLIEIGMEELPPKAMPALSGAFEQHISEGLAKQRLGFSGIQSFAAPRRLAVLISNLELRQPDESVVLRGPPVKVAFDEGGVATRAAQAFAKKAGVAVDALGREATDKGEWLTYEKHQAGADTSDLLEAVVANALEGLPIPRRMRWGAGSESFIRPLHWLVMIHGESVVPATLFDIAADRLSYGHRFHAPGAFSIDTPAHYPALLSKHFVIADFSERRKVLWHQATKAAAKAGGVIEKDDALIDEVTALCDWPVAVVGAFDEGYLELPPEVLESTLKVHQRYFPVSDATGKPMHYFVTIANIDSQQPDEVRRGNERVVAPRLADAAFFWNNDTKKRLEQRINSLDAIVYQKALGSIGDKVRRVGALIEHICQQLKIDATKPLRANALSKCDLVTDMVGEFPDLQGVMGSYYAAKDGEDGAVVKAIREQYYPRFAGDVIPSTREGQLVSIAERIDTLTGIFAIGKRPTGNRDPFGLRRAALGLLRTLIEAELDLDITVLIGLSVAAQPVDCSEHPELAEDIYDYVIERLRYYYHSNLCADRGDLFDAVLARAPHSIVDFDQRMHAVASFVSLPEAQSLAAANKRIANILRSGGVDAGADLVPDALVAPAAQALFNAWQAARKDATPLLAQRDYQSALRRLSEISGEVDHFFDNVMVMDDDVALRRNRMALLSEVRGLFLEIADISELASSS